MIIEVRKTSRLITVMAGVLLASAVVTARAAEAEDKILPPPLPQVVAEAAGDRELHLLGHGHFRKLLWDVFDISLWIAGDQWSFNEPFALELRYVRDVKGEEIVEGTRDQWKHLEYPDTMVSGWLSELNSVFPNVKKGDQLAGVYLPGKETRFFHNSRVVGMIADPEFGRAFFSIWLDPKTSQPKLREDLLGNGCAAPTTVAHADEAGTCGGGATMRAPTTQRPGAAPL